MLLFMLFMALGSAAASSQVDCVITNEECAVTDNLHQTFFGVPSIRECMDLCHDENNCTAFNYFGLESEFPTETCMLLTSCDSKLPCEGALEAQLRRTVNAPAASTM